MLIKNLKNVHISYKRHITKKVFLQKIITTIHISKYTKKPKSGHEYNKENTKKITKLWKFTTTKNKNIISWKVKQKLYNVFNKEIAERALKFEHLKLTKLLKK